MTKWEKFKVNLLQVFIWTCFAAFLVGVYILDKWRWF